MSTEETTYFFSYAREDGAFVLKLAKELRAAGAKLWMDQLDILGGERWDRAVEKALMACQGMIVVLSPESVNSDNVMDEVSYALEEKKLVVPVLHKDCSIPFRLRRIQRIDFTADYDAGFTDLLRALRIEQPPVTTEMVEAEKPVAQEGKTTLSEAPKLTPVETKPPEPKPQVIQKTGALEAAKPHPLVMQPNTAKMTWRERGIGTLGGAAAGAVFALIFLSPLCIFKAPCDSILGWILASIYGIIPGSVVGVISGTSQEKIKGSLILAAAGLGFGTVFASFAVIFSPLVDDMYADYFIGSIFLGGVAGAIAGAISGTDQRMIFAAILGMAVSLPFATTTEAWGSDRHFLLPLIPIGVAMVSVMLQKRLG